MGGNTLSNLMEVTNTIKSTELVDIINTFRKEEGNNTELQHKHFMEKIRREIGILKSLGLGNQPNFRPVKYKDKKGELRNCFELNRDGMLEMLNSESAYVRYKTIEYINKLEEQLKQPRDSYMIEDPIERAKVWIKEQEERLQLKDENKKLKPMADFGSAVASTEGSILVRDYSKILQSHGFNIPERKLWQWLLGKHFIYRRARYIGADGKIRYDYMPYADTVKRGLIQSCEHPYMSNNHGMQVNKTVRITGKGQETFFKMIVNEVGLSKYE